MEVYGGDALNSIINYAAILFGITAALWIILSNIGRVWKVVANSIIGLAALMFINQFIPALSIGINAVTCLFCGFLGVPGFFTLYIIKFLL